VSGVEELSREELIGLARDQAALIARLREANTALEERVPRLERQASRNSGNSSPPPSTDDLPATRNPRRSGEELGTQTGKRQGAQGNTLAWVAVPDERTPHHPQGRCGCGAEPG
jgi:transposase